MYVGVSKRAAAMDDLAPGAVIDGAALLKEAREINAIFQQIIERLAMAGSSVHAAQRLFVIKTEQLKKAGLRGSEYDTCLQNAALIEEAFTDEIRFTQAINKMCADAMLKQQGIDPNDTDAVRRHVQQNLNDQAPGKGD